MRFAVSFGRQPLRGCSFFSASWIVGPLLGQIQSRVQQTIKSRSRISQGDVVDAASVFGNFEMMNRVAEGTGIAVPPQAIERMKDTIDELGMVSLLKS